jgi:uncharacterized protein
MTNKIKYDYIIYHKNCIDGFTGFYLFMKTKMWKRNPFVYPDVPSTIEIPPNIKNKNVIIIDVAYKSNILKQISQVAKNVLFIDHHITIRDDVISLKSYKNLTVIYDKHESGASLVHKYFYPKSKIPEFVKYIKDNDIGKWKYKQTLPFLSALEVSFNYEPTHNNLKKWDLLLNNSYVENMIEKGKIYEEYKKYLIKKQASQANIRYFPSKTIINDINDKHILTEGMYKIAILNGGCPSTSLVGKYIAENIECDFCMLYTYNIHKKIYIISLRSKSMDVGEIAKLFGGGGHKLAAAFSISSEKYHIDDLFIIKDDKKEKEKEKEKTHIEM